MDVCYFYRGKLQPIIDFIKETYFIINYSICYLYFIAAKMPLVLPHLSISQYKYHLHLVLLLTFV